MIPLGCCLDQCMFDKLLTVVNDLAVTCIMVI